MTDRLALRKSVWPLLSTVVLLGKVVGMGAFVVFDLATTSGVVRIAALVVAALSVAMTFVSRQRPVVAMYLLAGASSAMSVGAYVLGRVGISANLFGLAEVAALAIIGSDLAHRETPARASAGILAAGLATATIAIRLGGPDTNLVIFWLVLAVAAAMGVVLRWADRNREITADVARREERMAIARELHDGVAHHVSAIVIQAQAALAVAADDPAPLRAALENIEQSGADTMASMRRLVDALRTDDAPLVPTAGVEDIRDLVDQARRDGLDVELAIDAGAITTAIAPSVYRIVQESLTNVRRHGREVTEVEIEIRATDGGTQVTIADDGAPADRQNNGHGLTGMSERVAALGGHFWAGPRPGRGWSVRAWIPLEKRP